ncbi:hypothetical protein NL676_019577 [Syzygium grande]|nr:hypothetical protein NL676_019577 [Syzygium grande]
MLVCFYLALQLHVQLFVVLNVARETVLQIGIGVTCFLLMSMVILFGHVAEMAMYFVCKFDMSLHENVDKFLAEHLQAYLGVHVPLKIKGEIEIV